ncbi:MAG: OB-fold nucleic acid binding domain-containing protein, partial [Thermodesulfobacteriota bacterium]
MLEHMGDWKRTDYCGVPRAKDIGRSVVLMGWVQSNRDHGGVIFIDLRDREGIIQIVLNPQTNREIHEKASALRDEWVIAVTGRITSRSPETVNPNLPTGEIEVIADGLRILNTSKPLPFLIENDVRVDELLRLK